MNNMMRLFDMGRIVATRGVNSRVSQDTAFKLFVNRSLFRHSNCDWGDLCDEDKAQNDEAVESCEDRIFSVYEMQEGNGKIWIITEWDRSVTTILFPEEY